MERDVGAAFLASMSSDQQQSKSEGQQDQQQEDQPRQPANELDQFRRHPFWETQEVSSSSSWQRTWVEHKVWLNVSEAMETFHLSARELKERLGKPEKQRNAQGEWEKGYLFDEKALETFKKSSADRRPL